MYSHSTPSPQPRRSRSRSRSRSRDRSPSPSPSPCPSSRARPTRCSMRTRVACMQPTPPGPFPCTHRPVPPRDRPRA
eukprot:scaffold135488_cov127-Phaeocystis_antarctica.AAC.1